MGRYVPGYSIYEPEERRSGGDTALWLVILAVILVAVGWYGVRQSWFSGHASLHGEIVDDYSKKFTAGSLVLMDSRGNKCYETTIASNGTYEFIDITPGNYEIRVNTVYGYYPGAYPVRLRKNQTQNIKLWVEQWWLSERKLASEKANAAEERRRNQSGSGGG